MILHDLRRHEILTTKELGAIQLGSNQTICNPAIAVKTLAPTGSHKPLIMTF